MPSPTLHNEKNCDTPSGRGTVSLMPDARKLKHTTESGFRSSSIDVIEYSYPLKLMIPSFASSSECKWIYPVSFGGGLVEGDSIDLSLHIGEDCAALLTTQSSKKVYCCSGGKESKQTTSCRLSPGAFLAILPGPTVPYQNAIYSQSQTIDLTSTSNLILLDWLTAGRVARKEIWDFDRVSSSYLITIDGKSVFRGGAQVKNSQHFSLRETLLGYEVIGNLVLIGPKVESLISSLEEFYACPKDGPDSGSTPRMMTYTPLDFSAHGLQVKGCILRFRASSVSTAYQEISSILEPLFPVFGGNPFENKF